MLDPDKVEVDVAVVHGRVNGLALAQSVDIRARLVADGVEIVDGTAVSGRSAARVWRRTSSPCTRAGRHRQRTHRGRRADRHRR